MLAIEWLLDARGFLSAALISLGGRLSRRPLHGFVPFMRFVCRNYFLKSTSAKRNAAKTMEITPFIVKNAALSFVRLSALTRECS